MRLSHALAACSLACVVGGRAAADIVSVLPPAVRQVGIDEHLGSRIPLDLPFADETGQRLRLGSLFPGNQPVILILAYYHCPMLCGLVMSSIVHDIKALAGQGWELGRQFRVVTVSFDPADGTHDAFARQVRVLQELDRPDAQSDWPFLVGEAPQIQALTSALGFRYAWDARTAQFAHAAVAFVLTPGGRISRYLYGLNYSPQEVKGALENAAQGKIGGISGRVIQACYHYDLRTRRYGAYVIAFIRIVTILVILAVGTMLFALWRRDRRRQREPLAAQENAR